MSTILWANNAGTTIASSVSNVATTVTLTPGAGALFPAPGGGQYFVATFTDAATGLLKEIVHVTNVTGDVATIVRAQEGTTALAWLPGDLFDNLVTAGTLAVFSQTQTPLYFASDTGTTNTLAVTLSPAPANWAALVGVPFWVEVANTNSGAATINANAFGAKSLVTPSASALGANAIVSGGIYEMMYDGTHVQVLGLAQPQNPSNYLVDTGAANAYVITPSPTLVARVAGQAFRVKIGAGNTNTGASTINDGLGAVAIKTRSGGPLPKNSLYAGTAYTLLWDGTYYRIQEAVIADAAGNTPAQTTNVPNTSTYTTVFPNGGAAILLVSSDDGSGNAWMDAIAFQQYGNPVTMGSSSNGTVPARTYRGTGGVLELSLSAVGINPWSVNVSALTGQL